MRNRKIIVVALIGLLMAAGIFLVSCDEGCDRGNSCWTETDNNGEVTRSSCGASNCSARNVAPRGSRIGCSC